MLKPKIRMQLVLAILPLALAPAVGAQKPKPAAAKPDPAVKAKLTEFKKLIKDRKGAKDVQARTIVDGLLQRVGKLHPKDKKDFAKALYEPLRSTSIKRKPDNANLYAVSIIALGQLGSDGSGYLMKAFHNKKKFKGKEWISLRAKMLRAAGKTKDVKQVDPLLDVALKDIHDPLMAAAGAALGEYGDAPLKVRWKIGKDLIKKFISIYNNAHANLDSGDLQRRTWEDRLKTVHDPWNTALQKITKQNLRTPKNWERFYNKHKNDNWDKLKPFKDK